VPRLAAMVDLFQAPEQEMVVEAAPLPVPALQQEVENRLRPAWMIRKVFLPLEVLSIRIPPKSGCLRQTWLSSASP
jgi:hypothetical protein